MMYYHVSYAVGLMRLPVACSGTKDRERRSHPHPAGGRQALHLLLPAGTRDTLTQTRTHGFGRIAICGLQRYFGDRGRCPEGPPPRHRRQLPRAHHQHLQELAPRHRPTHRRRTCLYIIHRCQGRPTLRNRLGCRCRVLHCSRPAPKVGDQNARARRPSPHQKSAFLHHLGRQH